ncbi:MAG: futalosine hydrolase [Saprospiraceae bacterium]
MNLLLVSATPFEIAPTLRFLEGQFQKGEADFFQRGELRVWPLVTGVGIPATMWSLADLFARWKPDLAVNAGVAGSFSPDFPLGSVVNVVSERWGDLGVEERDGAFTDVFELGLTEPSAPPYLNGILQNPAAGQSGFLPKAQGLTVQKVHGSQASIDLILKKYPDAQVESMEGAAFFFACLRAGVPFLEIRAISNRVEPRNRAGWDLPGAIGGLNEVLVTMLETLG